MGKPVVASRLPLVERTFRRRRRDIRAGIRGRLAAQILALVDEPLERDARVARTADRDPRAVVGARGGSAISGWSSGRLAARRAILRPDTAGGIVTADTRVADRRPRLRRPAARAGVRRGRPGRRRASTRPPRRVDELCAGRSPIDDIDDARLRRGLEARLPRSSRPEERRTRGRRDVVVRLRPDPDHEGQGPRPRAGALGRRPRREHAPPGQLVVLQSTTFPGTTDRPVPDGARAVGPRRRPRLRPRVRPRAGQPRRPGQRAPRRSRGSSAARRRRPRPARRPSSRRINTTVHELSSPDAAELAKLLENVFRNVNIALVNQLALLCERMGLDVWEVIDAAATKPFGFMPFRPGPGRRRPLHPGRPVLPLVARPAVRLRRPLRRARRRHQPRDAPPRRGPRGRGAQRARSGRQRARVGVIGVAFKPNVRDPRNSPAAEIMARLAERGAEVAYHDPHVPAFRDAAGRSSDESAARRPARRVPTSLVVVTPHARSTGTPSTGRTSSSTPTNSSRGRVRAAAPGAPPRRRLGNPPMKPVRPSESITRCGSIAGLVPAVAGHRRAASALPPEGLAARMTLPRQTRPSSATHRPSHDADQPQDAATQHLLRRLSCCSRS